jgi:4-carboxymuconolactone decarboxylase
MRLPLIAQADLTPEQRPIYEDMRAGIDRSFQGFKSIAENGALLGPWNPWLHEPKFGKPIWELTKALSSSPSRKSSLHPASAMRRRKAFRKPWAERHEYSGRA